MLVYRVSEKCAYITLNRPEKRNALNPDLIAALQNAFENAISDENVRVIQLEGEGKVFCAGADLASLQEMRTFSDEENLEDTKKLAGLFQTIYVSSKPVIAVVKGAALAGGCGLATVCDITLAEENAKFGYTETRLGFVPAIVSVFAARKLSETHLRRLLLAAEIISAQEAERIHLITEAVPAKDLDARSDYWRKAFIHSVSSSAVSETKRLIESAFSNGVEMALQNAVESNVKTRSSDPCRKGIDRFLSGEKIDWST